MDEDGLPIVGSGVDLTKVRLTLQHQLLLTWYTIPCLTYIIVILSFLRFQPFSREESSLSSTSSSFKPSGSWTGFLQCVRRYVHLSTHHSPLYLNLHISWKCQWPEDFFFCSFPETSNSIITNPTDWDYTKHFRSKGKSRQGFLGGQWEKKCKTTKKN